MRSSPSGARARPPKRILGTGHSRGLSNKKKKFITRTADLCAFYLALAGVDREGPKQRHIDQKRCATPPECHLSGFDCLSGYLLRSLVEPSPQLFRVGLR